MSRCSTFSVQCSTFASLLAAFLLGIASAAPRPNIIVVMVDDMGYSDIGCYGGEIDTPNIDRMARNGLQFSSFYNAGRCCPTRASLLTGLYPHKTGLGFMTARDYGKPGYRAGLNRECVTIAEALKPGGYGTYLAGKWHVCHDFAQDGPKHNWPLQRGFDAFYGTLIAAGSQWNPLTLAEGNDYVEPRGDFFYTEAITAKAVEYITRHPGGSPFFLYVAHTSPHWPLHARKEVVEKYRGRFAAGWDVLRRRRHKRLIERGLLAPGTGLSARDAKTPRWEDAEHREWEQSRFEAYAAMIDHVDQGMGQITAALEKRGELGNTLILFLSDNGGDSLEHMYGEIGSTGRPWAYMRYVPLYTRDGRPVVAGDYPGIKLGPDDTHGGYGTKWANVSNTPFRKFKKYAHEGGISTPLIAHWPAGIETKGEIRHNVGHVIDIMATCLDVAGIEYPAMREGRRMKSLDGKSLLPLFRKDEPIHDALFWEHHGNRGVRRGRWKLVAEYSEDWELYDMVEDRTETADLAKQHPSVVSELADLYREWAARSDVLPRDELVVKEIPDSSNPLTRSPEEMRQFLQIINKVLKTKGQPTFKVEE
jgi:arylsulfatase A-like enzyme